LYVQEYDDMHYRISLSERSAMTELAGCIILNSSDQLLVAHRNTEKLEQYEILGGKIEPFERAYRAARREVQEEAGIDPVIVRQLGRFSFTGDGVDYRYTFFLAKSYKGTPRIGEPEIHDSVEWMDQQTLVGRNDLSQPLRYIVEQILSGAIDISGTYPDHAV
jgi:8-oxo-dGTP pyrophosphatase MutT (NUDIX family)